jgi:hypothetical protein
MLKYLLSIILSINSTLPECSNQVSLIHGSIDKLSTNCVTFSVSPGTGCAWMCNYCSNQLGTNNYYFTNNVCTYGTGGCNGNPVAGVQYTCCTLTGSL